MVYIYEVFGTWSLMQGSWSPLVGHAAKLGSTSPNREVAGSIPGLLGVRSRSRGVGWSGNGKISLLLAVLVLLFFRLPTWSEASQKRNQGK